MNIFLASPVRGIEQAYEDAIAQQVINIEREGHKVYWPLRDTVQAGSELRICEDNRKAIEACDMVYVIWDGFSQGVLFDLGMAFALGKPVRTVIGYMPRATNADKSFQNMIFAWEETT